MTKVKTARPTSAARARSALRWTYGDNSGFTPEGCTRWVMPGDRAVPDDPSGAAGVLTGTACSYSDTGVVIATQAGGLLRLQ